MELNINPKFEIRNSKQFRMTKNSKSKKKEFAYYH